MVIYLCTLNKPLSKKLKRADLIMQKFGLTCSESHSKEEEELNPMIARALALPKSSCFDGYDAVELQREWRDEWR